jgi:hypothetical protein
MFAALGARLATCVCGAVDLAEVVRARIRPPYTEIVAAR